MMTARERAEEFCPVQICECVELSNLHGHPVQCLLCRMEAALIAHAQAVQEGAVLCAEAEVLERTPRDKAWRIAEAIRAMENC